MPTISFFYGIAIRMYSNDHQPPHCHAFYGDFEAQVAISSGETIKGSLPSNARRLVREWVVINRAALEDNWQRARHDMSLEKIHGLDAE